jgi:hypothetical protein
MRSHPDADQGPEERSNKSQKPRNREIRGANGKEAWKDWNAGTRGLAEDESRQSKRPHCTGAGLYQEQW